MAITHQSNTIMTETLKHKARKARLRLYNKNKGFSTNCVLLSGDWLFGAPKLSKQAFSPRNMRGLASYNKDAKAFVRRVKVPVKSESGNYSFVTTW